ncbi:MAG: hypothetical protein Q7S09_01415, partial [bacterium]|nr:hypothetical protein [bacterium]
GKPWYTKVIFTVTPGGFQLCHTESYWRIGTGFRFVAEISCRNFRRNIKNARKVFYPGFLNNFVLTEAVRR